MKKKEEGINLKNVKIRKVNLNNKARKGFYYYIKEKGKRPAYYKIREGVSLDNYILAYEGKVKIKKKGVMNYARESPPEKYLQKVVSRRRNIDKLISKGITETTVNNLHKFSRNRIHKTYMEMLSPLVKDKELLHIIALNENVQKFKHRIQTIIEFKSEDGRVELELRTFNKTLEQVERDIKELTTKRGVFESDLKKIMNKGYKLASVPRGFDLKNYEKNFITTKLSNVRVKLKFVKAK